MRIVQGVVEGRTNVRKIIRETTYVLPGHDGRGGFVF